MFDPDQALGPAGGFGAVFAGRAEDGSQVAVKRIFAKTATRAARELELADYLTGHEFLHVIPILDAGFDEGTRHHYIVMARADMSLQDMIERSAPLPEADAVAIVDAIAAGLAEIDDIVHRDLKPGNVLLHNGVWKLADLGLARFVEDATSLQTMKDCWSSPYASPEQWRGEHATKAADVYAAGCILYALMTGKPPFAGPTHPDYQYQHLNQAPPELPASPALSRIAITCLAKSPLARPAVDSLRAQLRATQASHLRQPGLARLAQAGAFRERKRAEDEAARRQQNASVAARKQAAQAAIGVLLPILNDLVDLVRSVAPSAEVHKSPEEFTVKLEDCYLDFWIDFPVFEESDKAFRDWDVLAGGFVGVRWGGSVFSVERSGSPSRSANVWFADPDGGGNYRWWEVSYYAGPKHPGKNDNRLRRGWEPFGLTREGVYRYDYGNHKLSGALYEWYKLAHNLRPVDGECSSEFCERWAGWLAKILEETGSFTSPPMPEEPLKPEFLKAF